MKLIISTSTIERLNREAADIVEALLDIRPEQHPVEEITDKANFSVTKLGEDVVYELNDEGLFKYMALYLKIARIVAPIMKLMSELNSEVNAVVEFYNKSK